MLTQEQIRKLAEDYKHATLQDLEHNRTVGAYIPKDEDDLHQQLHLNAEFEAETAEALAFNDFAKIKRPVMETIADNGLDIPSGSPAFNALCRAFLQQSIEIYRVERERMIGNYKNGYDDAPQVTPAVSLVSEAPAEGSLLLSAAVGKYIEELKTMERTGDAAIYEAVTKCDQFVKIIKDKPVSALKRDDVMHFLDVLKRLPTNATKSPQYRGKTIDEILAMKPEKTMSSTTVNNYMVRVKSFLAWCVRMGHLTRNPADGVTYGKKSMLRPDELRKTFSKGDLQKLVDGFLSLAQNEPTQLHGRPERLWLPLISVFSGMRVNEIAQLHAGDVQQDPESGLWCFTVELSEEGEDTKRIKSAAARRLIPVHPALISLGFIDHVEKVQEEGDSRLWMNLQQTGRGYHKSFANWFLGNGSTTIGFLRRYITTDSRVNFHSLRHTFADAMKQRDVPHHMAAELLGHAQEDMTYGRYGKPGSLQKKMDIIKEIDYGVQFGQLKEVVRIVSSGNRSKKRGSMREGGLPNEG